MRKRESKLMWRSAHFVVSFAHSLFTEPFFTRIFVGHVGLRRLVGVIDGNAYDRGSSSVWESASLARMRSSVRARSAPFRTLSGAACEHAAEFILRRKYAALSSVSRLLFGSWSIVSEPDGCCSCVPRTRSLLRIRIAFAPSMCGQPASGWSGSARRVAAEPRQDREVAAVGSDPGRRSKPGLPGAGPGRHRVSYSVYRVTLTESLTV